ncbi:MAG: NEW3 domain-containing protein [Candidatus Carbobacillus sp.]|nr:NEW3 domain-containing protein [Candidatus Carbobacillus sp.]
MSAPASKVHVLKRTLLFIFFIFLSFYPLSNAFALPSGVTFFTPYTDIDVTPGETISYTITIKNPNKTPVNVPLRVEAPTDWKTRLSSGGYTLSSIAVDAESDQTVNLSVDVPLKIDMGTYQVRLVSQDTTVLTLHVRVTEQGTYQVELKSDQPNLEGTNTSTFSYDMRLKNLTPDSQTFALRADAPSGWNVQFTAEGKDVTSVNVEAGQSKSIRVTLTPPSQIEAGTYKIPIMAEAKNVSAKETLEAVIRGTYRLRLTTPSGVLSSDITAGGERKFTIRIENAGSAPLRNVHLSADTPIGWNVTFDPSTVDEIPSGETRDVTATIQADKKAIAGDYVISLTARTAETSDSKDVRITVKTSLLWGTVALLIIALVLYALYRLIKKYGRR